MYKNAQNNAPPKIPLSAWHKFHFIFVRLFCGISVKLKELYKKAIDQRRYVYQWLFHLVPLTGLELPKLTFSTFRKLS